MTLGQLPLFPEAVPAAEKHRVLRSLRPHPYTQRVIKQEWPDGTVGWGSTISCGGRVLGDFKNGEILDAMYRDYVNTGGNP